MIGSRLHRRQVVKAVNVILRTYSSGAYADTTVYSDLSARYEQELANDLDDTWGRSTAVVDVFWFEPVDGTLPAIVPKHWIVEGSNRYEVMDTTDQGGGGSRLKVRCQRFTHPGD